MLPVTRRAYEQLDGEALALLRAAVSQHGSITAVARLLGYSRPAISGALGGTYGANVSALRTRIYELLREGVICPHTNMAISAETCRDHRERPMSTANRDALKQWQACRACRLGGCNGK